ncbi:MAG: hypothetical protein KKC29_15165 [Alphaproteobacteria bacterium]|jgi:hypothetical protein|nr:hypothetical protein [Alphaproteobacteria bacterium]MBU2042498.1 hypothetical protein [Alphaproteobacteria bacterium]MBU2126274.1 hypothetical protein [Alphaproteobacteria bacterium]MBU2207352.1 hypothetical protein [Alphaproteobacteria bacterium]MBU2292430.1 hypothetical protein [Alphaproteobacteria bacterium]
MSSLSAVLALTLALGAVGAASAQEPPARPSAQLDDVVLEGRQLEAMVRGFVNEVSQPANNRGLARWNRPVCVGAVNLRNDVARYVVDRISDVARELEVEAGEPGCRPNILIVAADDGAALASAIVEDQPRNFDLRHNGTDAGTRAFRNFRTGDQPVRWWQISMPIDAETGDRAVRLPGDIDPRTGQPAAPTIHVFAASRLRTQIRDDMIRSIIIVDVERAAGANLVQLADYLALVALAQVDAEADVSTFPTILNLFDDPAGAPAGLTDWDRSYLRALYEHDQFRINRNSQVRSVAEAVTRDRRAAAAEPE